jgi:hypothetical protein
MSKINDLIGYIEKKDLVLPEFQREYVWTKEQAKQLFVSLYKEYPVGGLLFWITDTPPELKNIDHLPEKIGAVKVILDGQQRLTTLYLNIRGEIPPYYKESDILTDPRDLYFNLSSGDFQYYQASKMKGNPLWLSVVSCYTDSDINIFEIAQDQTEDSRESFEIAKKLNNNLNQLRQIKEIKLPTQEVPVHASLDEAIDIFDRVNSQGTKLTDAELALTHVTGKWASARRVIKKKIEELKAKNFNFDLTFMVRSLVGVVCNRALFEIIHGKQKQELEAGWQQLSRILDYLVSILPSASIHSTEDLNTTNVLVPIIVYLSLNDGKFPTDKDLKNATHWLYAAHTMARYTAQTDQRLEHDVSIVVRESFPWQSLREQIIDQRGRIEVKSSDFEGRGTQHPLYRMLNILAKAHGAVDWFNGAPLGSTHGNFYSIHSHHIFPQSLLYKLKYNSESYMDRQRVNEIANRAFLTANTNLSISNKSPDKYFPDVEQNYPGALVSQFVPVDPSMWELEKYEDFLAARRELIALKINEFMDSLISEPEETYERPIGELIELGESLTLEFKSTLQWDVIQNSKNKGLHHSVLKSISAFLNTAGGTLIIGVEDDGTICGLENDFKLVQNSQDKFQQLIVSIIYEYIGPQYSQFIKLKFEPINGEQICVIDVHKSSEPVYMKSSKGKEFFVRVGNTTRSLDSEQTVNYVDMNWS